MGLIRGGVKAHRLRLGAHVGTKIYQSEAAFSAGTHCIPQARQQPSQEAELLTSTGAPP